MIWSGHNVQNTFLNSFPNNNNNNTYHFNWAHKISLFLITWFAGSPKMIKYFCNSKKIKFDDVAIGFCPKKRDWENYYIKNIFKWICNNQQWKVIKIMVGLFCNEFQNIGVLITLKVDLIFLGRKQFNAKKEKTFLQD